MGISASIPSRTLIIWHPAPGVAPEGYLKANGAAISRTAYAYLYGIIGTTFGAGDGSTTFNLPDLRAVFLRGLDDGRGIDTGRVLGTEQADAFKSHTHNEQGSTASTGSGYVSVAQAAGLTGSNSDTGATGGTETRPINNAGYYMIAFKP